jgi:hypothetical protein
MVSTDGISRTDYEFERWPDVSYGAQSVALSIRPTGSDSRGYSVTLRHGDLAVNLLVLWSGEPDEAEARRLAAAADARLATFARQRSAP